MNPVMISFTDRRLFINNRGYGSYKTYQNIHSHPYTPYSYNSEYKLFDDDPIPFYSRKNRQNYHRYRYRYLGDDTVTWNQYYSKQYKDNNVKDSQRERPFQWYPIAPRAPISPRVIYGPPIISGRRLYITKVHMGY